jgi:molybdopterin-synthase adenylyltransferase
MGEGSRYARQSRVSEIGEDGQASIAGSTAVVIGLGALGSPIADILARAGVGRLRLVDRDFVELGNLQRQTLYDEEDAASVLPKAEAAARRLRAVNSGVEYEVFVADVNPGNVERLVAGATVVLDGLDNLYTRALVNEACVKAGIPWVFGACLATCGNSATIIPGETACLSCITPGVESDAPPPLTCETAGILGPTALMVAAWEASEALKIMAGRKEAVSRKLTLFDPWRNDISFVPVERQPDCPVCGKRHFELLGKTSRLLTSSLCGRNAVQVSPPEGSPFDFGFAAETLGRLFELRKNAYLFEFATGEFKVTVFRDGRAIFFGTTDPNKALSLYGTYLGG